jgi:hypothetical protein
MGELFRVQGEEMDAAEQIVGAVYPETHFQIEPPILYFRTPVVLLSTLNEEGTANLAPMSSAWALGYTVMLGLGVLRPRLSGCTHIGRSSWRERTMSTDDVEAAPLYLPTLLFQRLGTGQDVPRGDLTRVDRAVEQYRPRADCCDSEHPVLDPRVAGELLSNFLIAHRVDDEQDLLLVERAAEDDDLLLDEAVDELGVLGEERLLAETP